MSILQRNKKAAAGIGIAAAAVAAIALGTGTYAAFTDTQAGPGGTLAAGTLKLNVSTTPSGTTPLFNAHNIAPGYTSPTPMSITVANSGTLNGKLTAKLGVTATTPADIALKNYLTVSGSCKSGSSTNSIPFNNAPVSSIPATIGTVPLNAGDSFTCNFTFTFPNAGNQNDAQGGAVNFTSNFTLDQA